MNKIKIFTAVCLILFAVITSSLVLASYLARKYAPNPNSGTGDKLSDVGGASSQGDTIGEPSFLTLDEVGKHAKITDCWMVLDGSVYNFTAFLAAHPGGAPSMTPYCGKDGTAAYATKDKNPGKSHSVLAKGMLNQYFVGRLGQALTSGNGTTAGTSPTPTKTAGGLLLPTLTPVRIQARNTGLSLTAAEAATHNSLANCWLIISGNVYDVTSYIVQHPGGADAIVRHCGTDATTAFATKDTGSAHSANANNLLRNYLIGSLGQTISVNPPSVPTAPPPTPTPRPVVPTTAPVVQPPSSLALTSAEVAKHNNLADCWLIISGKVYNVTSYIVQHPGGASAITNMCGKESTSAYQTKGGRGSNHSNTAMNLLNNYFIGNLDATVSVNPTATPVPGGGGTTSGGTTGNLPAAITSKYPGATRISGKYEDNGSWEGKVSVNGSCRAIKVSSSGSISQDEGC